jgi:hypothetical protein
MGVYTTYVCMHVCTANKFQPKIKTVFIALVYFVGGSYCTNIMFYIILVV